MSSQTSYSLETIKQVAKAEPIKFNIVIKLMCYLFLPLGLIGFFSESNPQRAWAALHVTMIYWTCVCAASSGFTGVFHITNAQWVRPIRRLFESASNPFVVMPLFLATMYLGHTHLFAWSHSEFFPSEAHEGPITGKEIWLSSKFLYARDIIAIVILVILSRLIVKQSTSRDYVFLKQHKIPVHPSLESKLNVTGTIEQRGLRLSRLSPIYIPCYAILMTLFAFDQIMSVDQHWYSTMFGGFVFMGGVYLTMAWVTILNFLCRQSNVFYNTLVEKSTLHDLGKLLFGFGIFWAYLFWCHYLPIWYGNMPEETGWIITRLRLEPWHSVGWLVFGCCFVIPFFLGLSRDVKQIPVLLCGTGMVVAFGMWIQHFLLFLPTLTPKVVNFGFTEVSIFLSFVGIFLLGAESFLSRNLMMPVGDIDLEDEH